MSKFLFFYGCFIYCSKNWLTISCKFFKIFLKKILKFCSTYFNVKIFVYFIQNLSRPYEKCICIFYKLKNFPHVFFEFCWISPICWNFQKFFPQFIQNFSNFPDYFLKIFIFKICLNIAWKCYECTKNVLRTSYKFFRNFGTVHKMLLKRLENLINFLYKSF